MNSPTDQQLLREYVERRRDAAFAELVRRHVDLVYSAALRMARDSHLAEDVTQNVFLALAKNAGQLLERPVLSGWLHRTAQNLAANAIRSEVRRRAREQEVASMNELLAREPDADWENIAPHLDAALGDLSEPDRDALLLRYFEKKSAREMAAVLNVSEEAAQKRVNRAVERLREFFSKRNVTVGASGLAVLISTNAVQAAPVGLFATISTAVSFVGAAASTSTAFITTKTIAMTTIQKTVVTVAITAAVGTSFYQAHQTSRLREELRTSQWQSAERIRQIETERDEVTAQLAGLAADSKRSENERAELLRLRGEVGRLRTREHAQANVSKPETKQADVAPNPEVNHLPKESWQDAGFATPEATLQTRGWTVLQADRERFKESIFITDDGKKVLQGMLDQMIAGSPDPEKARQEIEANGLTMEDAMLFPMIAQNKNVGLAGYEILSRRSPSADEMIFEVETQVTSGNPHQEMMKFRRIGNEWKVVIDEETIMTNMQKSRPGN